MGNRKVGGLRGSLKVKVGAFAVCIMLVVAAIYTGVSLGNMMVQQHSTLEKQRDLMLSDYDEKIQWQVQNVISLLKTYDELYEKEGLPLAERQERVKEIVRGLRYGTEGYFWIDTFSGVNVLLPPKPATEGTNRLDWTDEDGKHMVRDFIEIGKTDKGGFTDFKFPKLGSDKPEPKRSYTAPFRAYQWVVGTGNYIDEIDKALEREREIFNSTFRTSLRRQLELSIATVLIACVVFVVIIVRTFVRPIVHITESFRDISEGEGDLTVRLPVNGTDEISQLGEYFNRTIGKIRTAIGSIKSNAGGMQSLGASLARNADGTAAEISQIVASIDSINHQIDEQVRGVKGAGASVDSIAESITELDGKIEEQTASVSEASGAVSQMLGNIASVNESVEKMAQSFGTLTANAGTGVKKQKDVNERILQIDEQSRMLHEANKVISSIASQTNLLAMNAAIEAAHAGDAGKGFAVVADEIRKLSETSSAQSETIGKQLRNIRDSISSVVVASNEASGAFSAVSEQIGETESLVRHIKAAMDEQNQGSRRIGSSLADVNEKAVQVTSASKEIEGRNARILGEMKRLREAAEAMRQGVEDITVGARRIGDSSNGLAKSSADVRDAIGEISVQINQFKV